MDNLQDLEKAIICSIGERSLDKINDYFERSTFVAKNLNSQTLSILLKSLEQEEDKSNEDNSMNVKCVLQCLNKFLELKKDSTTWEHLSEDISKICELCFCISLNINDRELVSLNISVLDQMIRVNKNLTNHVFGYLLDPCLTALPIYCRSSDNNLLFALSTFTSSLCENASRMKRNEIVPTVTHHLNTLSGLLTLCGDYETQAAIVEILARCNSSILPSKTSLGPNEKLNLFSGSTKLREEYNKYSFVQFDPECRLFLNELNESLGDKRKVYSVPCICLVHNGMTLKKPTDPRYKSFWVDFNMSRKRISFYHELPNTSWSIEWFPFKEVVNVIAKDSVCTTKRANINIDSVKVEFTLCKKNILFESIELFKIYCRKTQFDPFHRVLTLVFGDVYTCDIDISLKDEIGYSYKMPVKLSSSTQVKEPSNPGETNKPLSPPASKSDEIRLALLKQISQQNLMHITSPTEKQTSTIRETFSEINSVSEGVNSNFEYSSNVDISKHWSVEQNNHNIEPKEDIYLKHKKQSIVVDNASKKSLKILKSPSLTDISTSKYEINDSLKDRAGCKNLNNEERTLKRKRLYSIEREDTHVKSIVLSSQDEQMTVNVRASPNKKLVAKEKYSEKKSSCNKNIKRRKVPSQKNKGSNLFNDENNSNISIPHLDSKKSVNYFNGVSNKLPDLSQTLRSAKLSKDFAENIFSDYFPSATAASIKNPNRKTYMRHKGKKFAPSCLDPDYKSYIKETECKVPNKRVLRKRNNILNKVDVIEKSESNKSGTINNEESNKDSPVPNKFKKFTLCTGADKSATKNIMQSNTDPISTSHTNESNFSLNKRLRRSQGFLNTIALDGIVEPTRDETCCNDIAINPIQPEDYKILPKQTTTYEAQCELEDQNLVPVDLDLTNSMDLICEELSSKNKLKSKRLEKGNPMRSCNSKVDEIPIEIHDESCCNDMSLNLIQSTFKVDDILEFSQKSVLNLKNDIKSSLIQSQEKRQQHLDAHGFQLKNTRHSILEHCEKLEVSCSKLNELQTSLSKTLDLQHSLILNIQREMANLEGANEQFFNKEAEAKNSEMFNIMNVFKSIGAYVRRLLFTSFRERALTI